MEEIGYAIDFKEIKRVGCQWIDDILDHGSILNPKDECLIDTVKKLNSKIWLMSLNGEGEYCNPSVENIAKEVFLAIQILFETYVPFLDIHKVTIYETPNCFTECSVDSISDLEVANFYQARYADIAAYREEKGIQEYDDRKIKS